MLKEVRQKKSLECNLQLSSYLSLWLVVNKLRRFVQVLLLHVEARWGLAHHWGRSCSQLPRRGPDGDIGCWWLQHLEAAEIE